jgi:signal transduction histidine kinase/CheY-like chemotaxis protein
MRNFKFEYYLILLIILWTVTISFAIYNSVTDRKKQLTENENVIAQIAYKKDIMYRRWASKQGGVYVPISNHTPPNPYLVHEKRDVITTHGDSLTLVNPAYMTRMVYEYSREDYNLPGHLISLNPVNPVNTPSPSEKIALLALEQGDSVFVYDTVINNKKYLQYIRPFVTEESCLSCHAVHGYKVGDIRGAISIAIPTDSLEKALHENIKATVRSYFGVWLLGLFALLYSLSRLKKEFQSRIKAENELVQSRAELKAIYDQSPVMMCVIDRNRRVLFANPAFTALTGSQVQSQENGDARDTIGCVKSLENTFGCGFGKKCSQCALLRAIEDTFESGINHTNIEFNLEIANNDDTRKISLLGTTAIIYNNNQRNLLLSLHDITVRQQVETTLRELEITRESAKRKQNFLANMSHEIRTPLTGLLGMLELLENTGLSDVQKDFLSTMKVSGENLKEIINQVLDYSKIEAGKVTVNPFVFEFASLIKDTENLYKNMAMPGVTFKTHIDPLLPRCIFADKTRITQILNNFTSNALKFTSRGSVEIVARLISSADNNNEILIGIEVKDTGPGIEQKKQKLLFVPFLQIEENDRRALDGTGLGLSICKELTMLLGGEVGIISEPGKGSTFWFTFPAIIAQSQPTKPAIANKTVNDSKYRILLAEDKLINQKVVNLILASLGHQVTIANNGLQALEIYQPGQFDLILMDIQMPLMDGITATQILKEKYEILPPIVGLSANAFEGDREKYMAMGMDEYLTKPVKKEDFEELIRKLMV